MKQRRLLVAALALALAPAPLAFAQEPPAAAKKEHTELEDRMEKMNSAWRRLRRQVADPAQNASSLELVAIIREASKGTEKMTPTKAADIPEADRAKFLADYAAGMKKFFTQLDTLEAALKAGKTEEAQKALTDIADYQKQSHKAFKKAPPPKQ